jgi:hypothetical protein
LHEPIPTVRAYLRSVVLGHVRYYGVPMNGPAIGTFRLAVAVSRVGCFTLPAADHRAIGKPDGMSAAFGSYCRHWASANEAYVTGLFESKGCPDPILEVQWAAATTGFVPEDGGSLMSVRAEVEVAAVPVPMVAVQ